MKYKLKYFLIILLSVICVQSFSQTKIDSLENIFNELTKKNIRNKTTINLLRELYEGYKISSPDSAIEYATLALEISVEIKDTTETAYLNRLIGDVYFNQKIYFLAMKSYYEALKIFDHINNDEEYAFSLIDIAYTHYVEEINDEFAINYYLESIKIFEKINNQLGLANAYNLIALVYSRQKKYSEALDYLIKSLIISQQQNDKQLEAQSYFDIALIYKNEEKYSEALGYLENALIISSDKNLPTAHIFFEKGNIYKIINENSKAIENYKKALGKYELNNDNINIADINNALANVYFSLQNYSYAIDYAQKALKISNENYLLTPKQDAYFILSNVYAEIGDIELAFRSFNYYSQIKDSIFSQKTADRYTDLQISIKTLLSEKEKQILKSEKEIQELKNKRQKTAIYLFIVIMSSLLILSIVLYNRFLLKRKSEKKLKQLADVSIEGIAFHDKGIIMEVNEKFTELIGYSRDELIGMNVLNFISEKDKNEVIKNLSYMEKAFYQITHQKKDGTEFLAEVSSRPIVFKKKNVKVVSIKDITEQKLAEKKLRETEMKFSTLVETSPDGVVIIDKSGKIEYASKTFLKLFEFENQSEIIGKNINSFITDEYVSKIKVDINYIFEGKYGGVSEYCAKKNNNTNFFIECNGEVLKNSENIIIGVFLIIRDITERKLTENALIESETRFRGLFDNANDGIIIHDKNFKIIDVNPYVSQILEYKYDELLNINFLLLVPDELKKTINLEDEIEIEHPIEIPVDTKSKKRLIIQLTLSKLTYENAQQYMSIIRNVTDDKIAEDKLRKSEEKYRTLAELLPATVCELDLQANFIFLNKNSYLMFGYDVNDKIANALETVYHIDHQRVRDNMLNIAQGQEVQGQEYTGIKKDGTLFPIMIYSSLLKQNNKPVGFRSIIIDISARKHYEEELKLIAENLKISNATKDKMFSIIAHDLRGPIGNLKAMMELLLESPEEFEFTEITEILSSLKDSSVSTYDLLENLLNWAKSQQGLVEYIPDVYDIKAVITNSISTQKANAENKKITISNEVAQGLKVICDVNMIKTVLRNLISNAIKFTKEEGKITIYYQLTDGSVIISVRDTGVGIEEKNLSKIFNENEYFTTYGTNREKGSGLGLMLCKEFIEKNNGKIWVESVFGKGATFHFTLKLN
jgi:PAS domain S-box-containing protein